MDEYKDWKPLRGKLPHSNILSDFEWQSISDNIGWLTFEDIFSHKTIKDKDDMIKNFCMERNLIE